MKKTILLMTILVLCICILSGCTENILNSIETKQEDSQMVQLFNSFEDCDYSLVKEIMPVVSSIEQEESFIIISDYIDGHVDDYKKIGYHYKTFIDNGIKTGYTQIVYKVDTEDMIYVVTLVLQQHEDSDAAISGFNVITFKEYQSNGAVLNFDNFDIVQLLLLVFSAACFGLVVYALVVCIKSKIRSKALWIIIILLLYTGGSITYMPPSFSFKVLFIAFDISSLRKYLDGSSILTIIVPIGAILFLCLKKRLINATRKYYEKQSASGNESADTLIGFESPKPIDVTSENLTIKDDEK